MPKVVIHRNIHVYRRKGKHSMFLKKTVRVLKRGETVDVSYSETMLIDEEGPGFLASKFFINQKEFFFISDENVEKTLEVN